MQERLVQANLAEQESARIGTANLRSAGPAPDSVVSLVPPLLDPHDSSLESESEASGLLVPSTD